MVSWIISRLVVLIFGTLYPAYYSYKAVKSKDIKEYGEVEGRHGSCLRLFLNCESAVMDTTAEEASMSFTVSSSTDHELPHGF